MRRPCWWQSARSTGAACCTDGFGQNFCILGRFIQQHSTNWLESWFIRLLQPNSKVQIKSQRNNSHQLVEVVVNQFHTCHGSSNQQFKTMRLLQPNDSSDQQPWISLNWGTQTIDGQMWDMDRSFLSQTNLNSGSDTHSVIRVWFQGTLDTPFFFLFPVLVEGFVCKHK